MSNAFGRKVVVALGLCASLFVSAAAYGIGGSTEGSPIIVCPYSVMAGTPIAGYITGGDLPLGGSAYGKYGNLPVPVLGFVDPTFFAFGTSEPMAGSTVTITAGDADGSSATAVVMVM